MGATEAAEADSTAEVVAGFMAVEDSTAAEDFTEEGSQAAGAILVVAGIRHGWVIAALALAVITAAVAFLADETGEAQAGMAGVVAAGVGAAEVGVGVD